MNKIYTKNKRKLRNRKKLRDVNLNRFRISVSKSLNNLSAQIIDDKLKKTLVSASSNEKQIRLKKIKKIEKSSLIGEILGLGKFFIWRKIMRKITKESSEAFVNIENFKKSNSEISNFPIDNLW